MEGSQGLVWELARRKRMEGRQGLGFGGTCKEENRGTHNSPLTKVCWSVERLAAFLSSSLHRVGVRVTSKRAAGGQATDCLWSFSIHQMLGGGGGWRRRGGLMQSLFECVVGCGAMKVEAMCVAATGLERMGVNRVGFSLTNHQYIVRLGLEYATPYLCRPLGLLLPRMIG